MGFKEEVLEYTHAKILENQSMKKYCGYGVGGKARYFVDVDSLYTMSEIVNLARRKKVAYKVIGNGTNILVSDKGYDGLIIKTTSLNDIMIKKEQVRAMAGATIQKLIKFCIEHSFAGLEPLCGIPASVGGAVVMNAGAFSHEIGQLIDCVEVLRDGKIVKFDRKDCKFTYRSSRFLGKKDIVVSATFNLSKCDREVVKNNVDAYMELRKNFQPTGRSCGCVFRNPTGAYAGKIIESLGFKGTSIGGAMVSSKHANFVITQPKASATDVYLLIKQIKKKAKDELNVDLIEEIEFVGEF